MADNTFEAVSAAPTISSTEIGASFSKPEVSPVMTNITPEAAFADTLDDQLKAEPAEDVIKSAAGGPQNGGVVYEGSLRESDLQENPLQNAVANETAPPATSVEASPPTPGVEGATIPAGEGVTGGSSDAEITDTDGTNPSDVETTVPEPSVGAEEPTTSPTEDDTSGDIIPTTESAEPPAGVVPETTTQTVKFGIENFDNLSELEKQDQLAGKLQENANNINALQEKKSAGTITPEEQAQLDQFEELNKELYNALREVDPYTTSGEGGPEEPVKTAEPGEEPPEPTREEKARVEAEKRDREIQAIKEKIKNDPDNVSPEDRNRLNQLKLEKGAQDRLKALEEKELSDDPLTDEEMRELAKLREKSEEPEDVEKGTPEQAMEKLSQELDTDYQAALEKMAQGEDATEEIINFNKKLADAMGYTITKQDEQDAREQVKGILNPEKKNTPESAKMRHIKEKLTELARYELQLQNQAKVIKEMNKNEADLKTKVNNAESAYVHASEPNQKQQNLQIFRRESVRLGSYQEAIKAQKGLGKDILVKRRQARGYIHRKLGTHGFLYNMGFGAGTAVMEAGIGIANSYDTIFDFA